MKCEDCGTEMIKTDLMTNLNDPTDKLQKYECPDCENVIILKE